MNEFNDNDFLFMDTVFLPFPNDSEIANLSAKIEQLNTDTYTQALQVKIESQDTKVKF